MSAKFILPNLEFEQSYRAYIHELGDEERYPFPLDFDHQDFPALLQRLNDYAEGSNIPEGFVPSTTYWLVENNDLIGVSNLRHYLNERLRYCGGHIGLGTRPSYRGRGFSNLLLAETIVQARNKGIEDIHIHCHKHNLASSRMIIRNGGMLDSEIEYGEPAEIVLRYIIPFQH